MIEAFIGVPEEGERFGTKHLLLANVLRAEDDSFWHAPGLLTAENLLAEEEVRRQAFQSGLIWGH